MVLVAVRLEQGVQGKPGRDAKCIVTQRAGYLVLDLGRESPGGDSLSFGYRQNKVSKESGIAGHLAAKHHAGSKS